MHSMNLISNVSNRWRKKESIINIKGVRIFNAQIEHFVFLIFKLLSIKSWNCVWHYFSQYPHKNFNNPMLGSQNIRITESSVWFTVETVKIYDKLPGFIFGGRSTVGRELNMCHLNSHKWTLTDPPCKS